MGATFLPHGIYSHRTGSDPGHRRRDIWNAGLPLLQHDTRHAVKRAFNVAASALAVVASPLTDLRTRLHLEIAKCNLSADSPAAALEEAGRADALDYQGPPGASESFRLERPWDRHLQPLLAALRSRAPDRDPGAEVGPVDSAVELIQRARQAREPRARRERLHKAIQTLERVPLVQPAAAEDDGGSGAGPGGAGAGVEVAVEGPIQRYRSARLLTHLWGEVVRVAWAQHLHDVVLKAAPFVLWPEWTPELDEEMAMLQVRAWLQQHGVHRGQSWFRLLTGWPGMIRCRLHDSWDAVLRGRAQCAPVLLQFECAVWTQVRAMSVA